MSESHPIPARGNFNNITGRRFGKLVAIAFVGTDKFHKAKWLCQCDCGNTHVVSSNLLLRRMCKSCGCLHVKHRKCFTPTYNSWRSMRVRCYDPKTPSWPNYGGRGVRVCERWESFNNFLADMGDRPEGTTLDRIDSDKDYEPGNCQWSSRTVQNQNKSNVRHLTLDGETFCLAEWSRRTGICESTIQMRLKKGWSIERALLAAVRSTAPPASRAWSRARRTRP